MGAGWLTARRRRPVLVPLLSLGQRMAVTEGSGAQAGTFALRTADVAAGRPALRTVALDAELFEAAAMHVGKDLIAMKVAELKEELGVRDEAVSGPKACLRRRLHAAIVRPPREAREAEGI